MVSGLSECKRCVVLNCICYEDFLQWIIIMFGNLYYPWKVKKLVKRRMNFCDIVYFRQLLIERAGLVCTHHSYELWSPLGITGTRCKLILESTTLNRHNMRQHHENAPSSGSFFKLPFTVLLWLNVFNVCIVCSMLLLNDSSTEVHALAMVLYS